MKLLGCILDQDIGPTTYNICFLPPKRTKSGGNNESRSPVCSARSQDSFKYINCGSNHSLGYRKCPAFLEAIARRKS